MANVKGNSLPAASSVSLTDILIVVNPSTGVAYRATVGEFIGDHFSVSNSTTTALDGTALNAAYPSSSLGFEVSCEDLTDGPLIYKKTATGWRSIPLGTV